MILPPPCAIMRLPAAWQHQVGALDQGVHDLLPLVDGELLGGEAIGLARGRDEDVDLAELVDGLLHHGLDALGVGGVARDGQHLGAGRLGDVGGRRLDVLGAPARDDHARAEGGERLGGVVAERPRAAGDDRDLAGQVEQVADLVDAPDLTLSHRSLLSHQMRLGPDDRSRGRDAGCASAPLTRPAGRCGRAPLTSSRTAGRVPTMRNCYSMMRTLVQALEEVKHCRAGGAPSPRRRGRGRAQTRAVRPPST